MKNVSELRIPAYAVVDMKTGKSVEIISDRSLARQALGEYKTLNPSDSFKLVKLQASKFVR